MTTSDRIRHLRKDVLGLSQAEFAEKIGLKQAGLSAIERETVSVTDRVIKAICSSFGISETWLRTGEGEMYSKEELFSLDRFAAEHGASELELAIVKAYFELDPAIRRVVLAHFSSRFSIPAVDPDELEAEALKQEYLREKKAGAASSASALPAGEGRTG